MPSTELLRALYFQDHSTRLAFPIFHSRNRARDLYSYSLYHFSGQVRFWLEFLHVTTVSRFGAKRCPPKHAFLTLLFSIDPQHLVIACHIENELKWRLKAYSQPFPPLRSQLRAFNTILSYHTPYQLSTHLLYTQSWHAYHQSLRHPKPICYPKILNSLIQTCQPT